jgi:hypothetical protein
VYTNRSNIHIPVIQATISITSQLLLKELRQEENINRHVLVKTENLRILVTKTVYEQGKLAILYIQDRRKFNTKVRTAVENYS